MDITTTIVCLVFIYHNTDIKTRLVAACTSLALEHDAIMTLAKVELHGSGMALVLA